MRGGSVNAFHSCGFVVSEVDDDIGQVVGHQSHIQACQSTVCGAVGSTLNGERGRTGAVAQRGAVGGRVAVILSHDASVEVGIVLRSSYGDIAGDDDSCNPFRD